jgi:hypothetical protein
MMCAIINCTAFFGITPELLKEFPAILPYSSACSFRIMSPVDGAYLQGFRPIAERQIRLSGLASATAACQQLFFRIS